MDENSWAKKFSAYGALFVTIVVMGLFGLGLIFSYWSKTDPNVTFTNLMETLKNLSILVVGYWVGSSNSSQKKDDTIAKTAESLAVSTPPLTTTTETKSEAPSTTITKTEPTESKTEISKTEG